MRRARNAGSAYSRSKPSRFDWLLWSAINKNTTKRNNLANVTQSGTNVKLSASDSNTTVNGKLTLTKGYTSGPWGADPYQQDATAKFDLGAKLFSCNNVYRYVGIGGTAVTAGKLLTMPAIVANHKNMSCVAAVAVGKKAVEVTLGGTAATLNQYAGGYLFVNDAAGEGQMLRVKSHPAQTTTTGSLVVTCHDPVTFALTTSSKISLIADPNAKLVITPTTATGAVVGATVRNMATNTFGWVVIKGPASLLTNGTVVAGLKVVASNGIAGAVEQSLKNTNEMSLQLVGHVMAVSGDTQYSVIDMNIN
jgi:hypothetical protein